MVKDLRSPEVEGTSDPMTKGCLLVPIWRETRGFPKLNYTVPDSSFFRWHPKKRRVVCVVTVTPDGLHLGWDTCGSCQRHFRSCECETGLVLPGVVAYLFESAGGRLPTQPAEGNVTKKYKRLTQKRP